MAACTPKATPFSREMGRTIWVQTEAPTLLRQGGATIELPSGFNFAGDWAHMGFLLSEKQQGTTLYGVWREGGWVLPCRFITLTRAGNFFMGAYYYKEELLYEVYNRLGTMVVGTKSDATLYPLDDTRFVLFAKGQAQVFDEEGRTYFADNLLTTYDSFAMCDDYLLSYRSTDFSCRIWQLCLDAERHGMALLLHNFAEEGTRYSAVYCQGRFLITALTETQTDYTYMDFVDGQTYFVRQQAWWYYPETGELSPVRLDFVLLGMRGKYAPGASETDKKAIGLAEGYTAVAVAVINRQGLRESTRYYVMNDKAQTVWAYPADINPNAVSYSNDVGFVSAQLTPARLYGLDGNMMWQAADHDYTGMVWQDERLVAAYSDNQGTHYGAFDVDGKITVPFRYEYVAPFVQGVSMAKRADGYVRLNHTGVETMSVTDIACEAYWLAYGCYVFERQGLYGVKNINGDVVLQAEWQAFDRVGRTDEGVYVVGRKGDISQLQRLQ